MLISLTKYFIEIIKRHVTRLFSTLVYLCCRLNRRLSLQLVLVVVVCSYLPLLTYYLKNYPIYTINPSKISNAIAPKRCLLWR